MRAFLVFLIFAGAGAYGFLAALQNLLPPVNPEVAALDQPTREAASGSWGNYLPKPSTLGQSVASDKARAWARPAITAGSQVTRYEEAAPATQPLVSQPTVQPALAATPARNTATEVALQNFTPKAATAKRKANGRYARPAPTDAATQTADAPQSVKKRRPFGFLFGRYAARE